VSESALFIVKKHYAALMIDKDGKRLDINGKPGKVKAMGLDLKRADTPKFVQEFLSEILLDTLTSKGEDYVIDKIRSFKEKFNELKPWQMGTPRAVNRLSHYKEAEEEIIRKKAKGIDPGRVGMPGHVRGSLVWNRMREMNGDHHSIKITDGMKIIVCKLKLTNDNFHTSIAFPVDEKRLPDWFIGLPFDNDEMEVGIVDRKIKNLLGCLKWKLEKANKEHAHLETLFDMSSL
jgi:hypothetical protein